MIDINKDIIQYKLPEDQYYSDELPKSQIFIHHTAGNPDPYIVVDGWKNNIDRVATSFVIAGLSSNQSNVKYKDGDIIQCFSSKKWAYHLGIKSDIFSKYGLPYKALDKTSIGIELCNWGYLTQQADGSFKNYVGGKIPLEQVVHLEKPYRGYEYYHAYSEVQLLKLKDLLIYLCDKYNISKKYNEGMFEINQGCLNGANGIWTHGSVRQDKWDCSPQPKLIEMLKNLANV